MKCGDVSDLNELAASYEYESDTMDVLLFCDSSCVLVNVGERAVSSVHLCTFCDGRFSVTSIRVVVPMLTVTQVLHLDSINHTLPDVTFYPSRGFQQNSDQHPHTEKRN